MTEVFCGLYPCDLASSPQCSQSVSVGASAAQGSRATSGPPQRSIAPAPTAPSSRGRTPWSSSSRSAPSGHRTRARLRSRCHTPPPPSRCAASPSGRTACGCSRLSTIASRRSPRLRWRSTLMGSPSHTRTKSVVFPYRPSRLSVLAASTTTSGALTCQPSNASRSHSLLRGRCCTLRWAKGGSRRRRLRRSGSAGRWISPARCSW
mmetsp:Transcript_57969/g.181699  ORF Transcript_57969/g.181699 Transcript_57969/m.181699 type:complete len:206 (-) Transcript_57969:305-922(-)